MVILFGAGHVAGAKIYLGYNEDLNMLDLAKREAQYAKDRYGQQTKVFSVTGTSYPAVEEACRGCDLAIFEHSNAEPAPVKGTANRVTIYRTVKNKGDGVCADIAKMTAKILGTIAYPVAHSANSRGNDAYGVLGRAMLAGCQDAWLAENGFHTHAATRGKLSDPAVRQRMAEAKIDTMAAHYGWEDNMTLCKRGDKNEIVRSVQRGLLQLGYDLGRFLDDQGKPTGADGDYGPTMSARVAEFKAKHKLPGGGDAVTVDDNTALLTQLYNRADIAPDISTEVKRLQSELATLKSSLTGAEGEAERLRTEQRKVADALFTLKNYMTL